MDPGGFRRLAGYSMGLLPLLCAVFKLVSAAAAPAVAGVAAVAAVVPSSPSSSLQTGLSSEWNASQWELVLLTAAATTQGARCLDGSPGGYQIRRGKPGNTRWVVFHQGGGWCYSDELCAARANSNLGSSEAWTADYTDFYEGGSLFLTPPFREATLVYALYCDGGSWAGNAEDPVVTALNSSAPAQTIYYRGRRLLDALYDHLLSADTADGGGLATASELLFAGCSAGALTVYMHADYVSGRMPPSVKTVALADAMFSIATPDFEGVRAEPQMMSWVFDAMNCSASVNQACLAANPNGTACMFGANVAPYIHTPTFVLNSKYDTWQGGGIIGAGACASNITNCSAALQAFWAGYGRRMVSALQSLPPQHGGFLSNCQAHCQTGSCSWAGHQAGMAAHPSCGPYPKTGLTVDGMQMGQAFTTWYNASIAALGKAAGSFDTAAATGNHRYIETCDIHTCGTDGRGRPGQC